MRRIGPIILAFAIIISIIFTYRFDTDIGTNYPIKGIDYTEQNTYGEKKNKINNKKIIGTENTSEENRYLDYNKKYVVKNIIEKKSTTEYYLSKNVLAYRYKNKYANKHKNTYTRKNTNGTFDTGNIKIGDIVTIEGEEKSLDDLFIQEFNYGRYLKSKGIRHYIKVSSMEKVGEGTYYRLVGKIKTTIRNTNRYLLKSNSDILNSIILGDKDIDIDTENIFTDSGTRHIMAISGLHIAILSSIMILMMGRLTKPSRLIVFCVVMKVYMDIVGGGASIQRAYLVILIQIVCILLRKRFDVVNVLCYIATYSILENPYIIYNISFQLSYLSMLSIGIYTKYIKKHLLFTTVSVSISSSILITPILALNFGQINMVSILGNIVILPFLFLIIAVDIAIIIVYLTIGGLYQPLVYIEDTMMDFLIKSLKLVGNYGVNNIQLKKFDRIWIVLYYIIVAVFSGIIYYVNIQKSIMTEEMYDRIMGKSELDPNASDEDAHGYE